ncbi:coiled-coil domain-containing protein 180-like isoform X3 [Saccostrea echinata]|uniref:coiled-coil domain-containing protein 180-like isoform X3 n=1 Tax=Saccostrea echinata TaxID=191078 RepID=UPI002A81BC73|nr:coiled-coil domain-containing protein 180-like isoform X3 [Saccostrea echinata]
MAETASMRVVPSGKIYRQMFDAQVQLQRSLTKMKSREAVTATLEDEPTERQSTAIPVVKLTKEDVAHGLLTERQRTWADGFPNDPYVENPVLHKQYSEFVRSTMKESESSKAGKEVQGLPDVVVPAKEGSNIIERIAASRKNRHESCVEDLHQELSLINSELEPVITEYSETLLRKLEDDDKEIDHLLDRIERDEDLLTYNLEELHKLWDEIQGHSAERQTWINELDQQLSKVEDDRIDLMRNVFKTYAKTLEKIAHLMPPDLSRFLDQESQLVNQTMLSNRRAYSDLYVRLMSADVEREKAQYTIWKRRVEDWRQLNTDLAIEHFSNFMQEEKIINPPGVTKVFNFMIAEQELINKRRLEVITQLCDLKPPASTKTAVYQWDKTIKNLTKEIDSVNQLHLTKLHAEYEKVCQDCLEKIEFIKKSLIDDGICAPPRAQQVVDQNMLPLVGERQRVFENNLETMEKDLEKYMKETTERLKMLFKFAQGAAHVWDVHEIGLAKQERALQEKLEQCRQMHDNQNQEKEAHLDIIMDRMRQDATEKQLKDSLEKALSMLSRIKEAYEIFHNEQMDIVKNYPMMVRSELKSYDEGVCKFFEVGRNQPIKKSKSKILAPKKTKDKKGDETESTSPPPIDTVGKEGSLPEAVSEILATEKGTLFYVLTEAGEYGIPPEKDVPAKKEAKGEEEEGEDGTTFMTEVEVPAPSTPEYIQKIDVDEAILIDVKKKIRMNFLNHMEEWHVQASERAESVVIAKCEELNSELELRFHLHKPRARRAELDVHNVRAAELVMHSERVTRHVKGIIQALAELRQGFNKMTQEHNKLASKFRQDIEALEVVFVNATKSSKLIALQSQLGNELSNFMEIIRTSLLQYRKHLDKTLQMLRESNARFIKSFKVFSDGGNFCPEEIDVYRKKLENMSSKIDVSEGAIMSDMEDIEKKRLDQATKVASEFEDRFKNHMIDLIFMEKIARWLTNTQVRIKAEVANSNSQAMQLAQHLNDLDRRIDACERPNLDKEPACKKEMQITSRQLNETLKSVFEAFQSRSVYLNCIKDPSHRPTSGTLQGPPALDRKSTRLSSEQGARVGFTQSTDVQPTPISKMGKQPQEDPSVNVIKSILRAQKSKMRFGMDADLDGELSGMPHHESREKLKSSMSTTTPSEKSKQTSKGKGSHSTGGTENSPKRVQSGMETPHGTSSMPRLRRNSKSTKFDRKYLVFGEKEEEGEENHILGIIKKTLREALDGLLTNAEMYYRSKGNRPVTRPQALQETFEACADVIVQKLQSYYTQSDEYHNQCLQEFRNQLTQLERSVAHVPGLLIKDILKEELQKSVAERKRMTDEFSHKLVELEQHQQEHSHLLRPTLGHPHAEDSLKALCEKEEGRHKDYVAAVEKHTKDLQNSALSHAQTFIDMLARTSEHQLLQYDNLLVVDDVIKGRVDPTRYPTSELIRRKNAGLPLEDDEDKGALPRGKNTWQGIASNELVIGESPSKVTLTASVTTAKTTLGHSATTTARDTAYQDYKAEFEKTLKWIDSEKQKQMQAEQRWVDSWNTSVEKVKQLY